MLFLLVNDYPYLTMSYTDAETGVVSHPKKGEIILNDAYLTLGEYYQVAIFPTSVKKTKYKPSVEGAVGDVATAIIARLRNEVYTLPSD